MGSGDRPELVRICDRAGRPRGTGFVADDRGTVVTSHEVVATAVPLTLHGPDGRHCAVEADAVTPLPELGLALVGTPGPDALGARPLPVTVRDRIGTGTYVRIAAHGWREARVLGETAATYTTAGRGHRIDGALVLALGTDGRDALRSGGTAVGGPVTDPETGAVLGLLSTALSTGHEAAGLAVPLTGPAVAGSALLRALMRRNAATVPGYGHDLNLAGAHQLTATSVGSLGGPRERTEPVDRPDIAGAFAAFDAGRGQVLGLVGAPGTGRTTELAALAARRAQGSVPALTLWLRGADLLADDTSVAAAMARTLQRSGRILAAAGAGGDMTAATPESVAASATDAGSPLLVVLDGPEEMPPLLAHRLAEWTAGTARWLRANGVRMVVACRPEHWETAGALYPADALHRPERPAGLLPPAVRLGDLTASQAERARERYGIPDGAITPGHERHPLTLRLLAEVREALPPDVPGRPGTEEVFGAHLDLMCVRIAVRIAAGDEQRLRGAAVRRLAVKVAGQVHEAARRCLGPGQGELDRAAFEELFPWRTGWASAVLTEGLLTPAGAGYRFAHEELGDWIQGAHLDLDAALRSLVHRWHAPPAPAAREGEGGGEGGGEAGDRAPYRAGDAAVSRRRAARTGRGAPAPRPAAGPEPGPAPEPQGEPRTLPVPRHRIGPVIQAMLLLGRRQGASALAHRMADLIEATDRLSAHPPEHGADGVRAVPGEGAGVPAPAPGGTGDALWWAAHLLGESLLRVPDARPYLGVLRVLAARITLRSAVRGGPSRLGAYGEFGPWFWRRLRLPEEERIDLLRRLLPADGAPRADGDTHYLDAVDRRLSAAPRTVQALLCTWFTDERPLHATEGLPMRPTVAAAAQALLYARRDLDVDALTDALVATAHPRAEELLGTLVEDETSALCRAVERWARDEEGAQRRAAAAAYAMALLAHAASDTDRALLRGAALHLLARPADSALHGAALTVLVHDPVTRGRYLPQALRAFAAGDPRPPVALLAEVYPAHPEPVLAALRARLTRPDDGAGDVLLTLAGLDAPALALHAAGLVRDYVRARPGDGTRAAAYVGVRLEQGPAARALLLPLVTGLLRDQPAPAAVRGALARVLGESGSSASRPLRTELLEVLLEFEQDTGRDPEVLDALLHAAATGSGTRSPVRTRALVHRTGMLLVRTPEGAARFDRRLVELARDVPGFAGLVTGWLADAPQEWAAVVGPGARRTLEALETSQPAMTVPMQAAGREHGSLRPA
ncbi:serine protease [Streptomyces finlayi]|uniref:Serine protease n=1 Tax=Streptomyces finlayi TaxID=67296 RepID=A0A7G7BH12_9ACTN|nr:trypsin-like peptidase domain-containing protein [Streptomyces finlayi]QNE74627.1 serine protease [Streptomyces finlayi]